jgi:segregation and condensation protein A
VTADVSDIAGDRAAHSLLARVRAEHAAGNGQRELPFAIVEGRPWTRLPTDLYIPPDALEVFLEAFEGPLDLLLYLIRRQNLDILDIRVAEITAQYMQYVELMQALRLELAAEYLVMAAMLAEIKSRLLLPRPETAASDDDDPRAELVRRLQEYEQIRRVAERIDGLPRMDRDFYAVAAAAPDFAAVVEPPQVSLRELLLALAEVLKRAELHRHHHVMLEQLSVRDRMSEILRRVSALAPGGFLAFAEVFDVAEGRRGVVVTFLALMELSRETLIEIVQQAPFAPIYVRGAGVGS